MIVRFVPVALAALFVAACAARAPEPEPPAAPPSDPPAQSPTVDGTDAAGAAALLRLADDVIGAPSTKDRHAVAAAEQARYERDPSPGNLLRLSIARTYAAADARELHRTRATLEDLLAHAPDLSAQQRQMARICLDTLDERLRLRDEIAGLEVKIRSLTAIERSLEDGQREAEARARERGP